MVCAVYCYRADKAVFPLPCRPNDNEEVMHLDMMRYSLGLSMTASAVDPVESMHSEDFHGMLRKVSARKPF